MAQPQITRTLARVEDTSFVHMQMEGLPEEQVWWNNVSFDEETGPDSSLMKMASGARSKPHAHHGPEEFFVLEGDLADQDGFCHRSGDFVRLAVGTSHYSRTETGCLVVVTHSSVTEAIQENAL